jgi:hypothetical protein
MDLRRLASAARPRHHTIVVGGLLAALALGAGPACSSNASDDISTPTATSELEIHRALRDIPSVPGSKQVQVSTPENAVVASFTVRSTTPQSIMEFFVDELEAAGWVQLTEPAPTGTDADAWRGRWEMGKRQLLVSAAFATAADRSESGHDDPSCQYSLTLRRSF